MPRRICARNRVALLRCESRRKEAGLDFDWLPSVWWAKWVWFLLGPFVQEDVAILTTAGYATGAGRPKWTIFMVLWFGVWLSDIWKYWIGRWVHTHPKAKAARQVGRMQSLERDVKKRLGLTLIGVRFVPLARIPTYAACGYFGVKYWRFCLWIAVAAFIYIAIAFTIFDLLGQMFIERYRWVAIVIAAVFLIGMAWAAWRRSHPERG